jgi:hypothetical protein
MKPNHDSFWEWLRSLLWPILHDCFDERVFFVGELAAAEYAGTVSLSETEVERVLRSLHFQRNPVAALKSRNWYPGDGDGVSEGSWAWRGNSWRTILTNPMQLHVTIFSNDDGTHDLLAHWEASWLTRPRAHYYGTDYHAEVGVAKLRELLARAGVEYEVRE